VIDHVGIRVTDFERSKRFFTAALAPLGYRLVREHPISGAGFGKERPDFWIKQGTPGPRVHIAFAVEERSIVDAFYHAALAAGARDDGAPGVRLEYNPNYYGAFVLDPDGHSIEAVCRKPGDGGAR
jgi:catechol 2,3-dioxygenase-like lactoylglutathione lyase family enzyme